MPDYKAPVEHMTFLLRDVFNAAALFADIPAYNEVADDLMEAILLEAAKLCEGELAPINRQGDESGCQLVDGAVKTAPGTIEAYQKYVEGGWQGLSLSPAYDGQGLPKAVQFLVDEMVSGANLSFGLFPGLTRGAVEAIEAHASTELKDKWLPKMVSGEWSGAMCLTEAQAGTDLALVRTKAEPKGDGSYAITGSKIFITAGDQDLTENIIYLVLARLPDAPAGVKGISLFLVPKLMVAEDGSLAGGNAVSVGALEHKMGIKASPTCVMNFDGSTGWLIGEANKGLAAMFVMMNAERLFVGVQGVGAADAAYQGAVAYAKERIQGRDAVTGAQANLLAHSEVRRMLLTARAWAEGGRAMALFTALQLDTAEQHADAEQREIAHDLVALLTPVVKGAGTDLALEATIAAQQVFGGHGYIREWGMEQLVRDVRITQIYEGTNGVQALDLVGRKLSMKDGALPRRFFAMIDETVAETAALSELAPLSQAVAEALAVLRETTTVVAAQAAQDPHAVGAAATSYMRQFALVSHGWLWLKMAAAAVRREQNDPRRTSTLAMAQFFMARLLPESRTMAAVVAAGSASLMSLSADLF